MLKPNGKKVDGKHNICSAPASERVSRQHLAQGTAVFATFSLKSAVSVWRAASKSCHCNRLHHMHIHELIACQKHLPLWGSFTAFLDVLHSVYSQKPSYSLQHESSPL